MGSVNRAILVGHLGRDPSLRTTEGGQAVCSMALATNEVFKNRFGEREERVEWHQIVAWGPLAENCKAHLVKGRQIYVEGRMQSRKWRGRDGQEKQGTEIVASVVVFLGGGGTMSASAPASRRPADQGGADPAGTRGAEPDRPSTGEAADVDDADIPF